MSSTRIVIVEDCNLDEFIVEDNGQWLNVAMVDATEPDPEIAKAFGELSYAKGRKLALWLLEREADAKLRKADRKSARLAEKQGQAA